MSRIRTPALLAIVAVAISFAGAVSVIRTTAAPSFSGTDLGPGVPAADFTLLSGDGAPVSLGDFRGRATILFFGYTTCPDVCPLTMTRLREVVDGLGGAREHVRVVLITVDPEVDTPAVVGDYARRFDPSFLGLGGEPDAIRAVARDYGVYASEPSAPARRLEGHEDHGDDQAHGLPARLISHSSYVFGITPDGMLRVLWGGDATADEIAADVRQLMRL